MEFRDVLAGAFLCLLPVFAADAAEVTMLGPDQHCVASIQAKLDTQGGIANGRLLQELSVRYCDAASGSVGLDGDAFTLSREVSDTALPVEPDARNKADDKRLIPDGQITSTSSSMFEAWLTGSTGRYGHAILGDAIEASGFSVLDSEGKRVDVKLDEDSVFEDLRVRLIDLNGDGADEFVVIRSYLDAGAALAVYGLKNGEIVPLGETPAIGVSHRWLNPAGAADFDGDGEIEIAYVETPHIGGTLRFVSLTGTGLVEEQAIHGFSNHAIGSRVLDMAAVLDWNADGLPDLAIPDASRSRMQIVSLSGGAAQVIASLPDEGGRHEQRITSAVVAGDLDADGRPELFYGLSDGTLVVAKP